MLFVLQGLNPHNYHLIVTAFVWDLLCFFCPALWSVSFFVLSPSWNMTLSQSLCLMGDLLERREPWLVKARNSTFEQYPVHDMNELSWMKPPFCLQLEKCAESAGWSSPKRTGTGSHLNTSWRFKTCLDAQHAQIHLWSIFLTEDSPCHFMLDQKHSWMWNQYSSSLTSSPFPSLSPPSDPCSIIQHQRLSPAPKVNWCPCHSGITYNQYNLCLVLF